MGNSPSRDKQLQHRFDFESGLLESWPDYRQITNEEAAPKTNTHGSVPQDDEPYRVWRIAVLRAVSPTSQVNLPVLYSKYDLIKDRMAITSTVSYKHFTEYSRCRWIVETMVQQEARCSVLLQYDGHLYKTSCLSSEWNQDFDFNILESHLFRAPLLQPKLSITCYFISSNGVSQLVGTAGLKYGEAMIIEGMRVVSEFLFCLLTLFRLAAAGKRGRS